MNGYFLALAIFVVVCLAGLYLMIEHNGGIKPGNWEDDK